MALRLRSPRWLVLHAGVFLVVNGFMVVTWLLSPDPATVQGVSPGVQQQFWPAWTMLLLAVPLGLHATVVLATRPARAPAAPARRRGSGSGPRSPTARPPSGRWPPCCSPTSSVRPSGRRQSATAAGVSCWTPTTGWPASWSAASRGRLVKSTGDGILATFDRPGDAIRCATVLRDRLRGIGVDIRACLHTGEVQVRGADVGAAPTRRGTTVEGVEPRGQGCNGCARCRAARRSRSSSPTWPTSR